MIDPETKERMREDWNRRAKEDANYYVAFGRRDQDDDEFFETGNDVIGGLQWEMKRLPRGGNPRARRALEVGCGPGRLMKPMARHFGEIHGVDVSDEMIQLARHKLRGIPHAHAHATSGADLAQFCDDSFDLVYSYAVFQHIPSKEVVLSYMREIARVLKPGGIVRAQINGLPDTSPRYDTWSGVRFSAQEILDFTRERGLLIYALEGTLTQYMWTTWRKPDGAESLERSGARIRRITNSHSSEPVAQTSGRFGAITLWMENLPLLADLNSLEVTIGANQGTPCYIGPPEADGLQQLNVLLPPFGETGLLRVGLNWRGAPLCEPSTVRVIPAGPLIPRIFSVSDGINLLSGSRITTRTIKIIMEEVAAPEQFEARVDGVAAPDLERFCADPRPPRYEFSFRLPDSIEPGFHHVEMQLGKRRFPPVPIEVA